MHTSSKYRDPVLDTLRTVVVSSFPYSPGHEGARKMRNDLSNLCHSFDLSYLTIGVNPHTETGYITMKLSNASQFVSLVDGSNHDNCIVNACVERVADDYVVKPWYLKHIENSELNVNLRAVVVDDFVCSGDPWYFIKEVCNSLNIRFMSTAFTNSCTTSVTVVDKCNAYSLSDKLFKLRFGSASVKMVKDSYSPPTWYVEEIEKPTSTSTPKYFSPSSEISSEECKEDPCKEDVEEKDTVEEVDDVEEVESDDDGPILEENIEHIPVEKEKPQKTFTFPLGSGSDAKDKIDFLTSNQSFLNNISFEVSVKLVFH